MSKIEELLRAKRQAQIAELEGREPETSHEKIDAELKKVARKSAKVARGRHRRRKGVKSESLYITAHAHKRMAQRRMQAKHVYAMWRYGDAKTLNDAARTAHVVTDRALVEMPYKARTLLEGLRGAAIIVQQNGERRPSLVTVLADGEDTHFG